MKHWIVFAIFPLGLLPLLGQEPKTEPSPSSLPWLDKTHEWLYDTAHGTVVWVDRLTLAPGQEPVPTPPSRFRIGMFSEVEMKAQGSTKLVPVADFELDVNLPNLEKGLKIFVSTLDPTAPPGRDPLESDTAIRVGASRDFLENWKTSAGVKAKWLPEAFAFTQWSPTWQAPAKWELNPKVKLFWESDERFGGVAALSAQRWRNRWMLRPSVSLQWSQDQRDEDAEAALDEENYQFGADGQGARWDVSTIIGYVPRLLDERDYGRRVGGSDVAKGYGLRASVRGNAENTQVAQLTLFAKAPIYKDFLYLIAAPEVRWADEEDWNEEYVFKVGLEMLLWGPEEVR